ncbi:MAG: ATP-dependent zinc metalloprotease FtsH [Phycisphaeraceae bacterium]|nr:ATP-dependent zinc metalloprotease FtsH [Phycisphaeraceae bacterium]
MFGLVVLLVLILGVFVVLSSARTGKEISPAEFRTLWESRQIESDSVIIKPDMVVAIRKSGPDGDAAKVYIPINAASQEEIVKFVSEVTNQQYKTKPPSAWTNVLPWLFPIVFLLLIFWMVTRGLRSASMGGGMLGNFGKSRHRVMSKEMTGVTFKDVAGVDEAEEEVAEIIEFLRRPKKFTKLGGRIPRGVLLSGPPGCGKTLLAKAIAGEADVPFFTISGSDFVEMFVGVGASRVRDLFRQAKESAPCIVFLDEIDAVGRRRGSGYSMGGHDEREQTLNAILVEMDGFQPADGVIVIAATNRPDVLDPALVRPGRFDRQISVSLPDVKGRLEILRVHTKKVKLGPDVDLEKIARGTPMFSGADLAAIINEAAIIATMSDKEFIEHEDLEEARDKVRFGRAKKSRVREKDENKLVAYHEAGHAVLQCLLPDGDPLHKVTIIPRGDAGGATFSLPERDRMGFSLKWLRSTMRVLCGGRIAEQRAMHDVSSGASMDIQQVTGIARTMILEWGMSERLGFVRYAGSDSRESFLPEREYSDETARIIDEEVRRIVDEAYADAERLITDNWQKVERVAQALLRYETLSADEVHRLMRGEELDKPTISDLLRADTNKANTPSKPTPSTEAEPEADAGNGILPSPA